MSRRSVGYPLALGITLAVVAAALAVGWQLHSVWDVGLHLRGPGRHVAPDWYAIACVSFDVLLAVVIARRVYGWQQESGGSLSATAPSGSASPAS